MANGLTTTQIDTIIDQIITALEQKPAGAVTYVQDPEGGQMRFESHAELAAALRRYQDLRKQAAMSEQGRSAVALARRPAR